MVDTRKIKKNKLPAKTDGTFAYYTKTHSQNKGDITGLDWSSTQSQEIRFSILIDGIKSKHNSDSVLDVGCGYGDLVKFIDWTSHYYGIDFIPDILATAKNRYPGRNFKLSSLLDEKRMFDWVLASGPFNVMSENNNMYLEQAIRHMWKISKKGIAFNILVSGTDVKNKKMFFYDPTHVLAFCRSITQFVICRMDYLPHDATFYLYHKK